MLTTKEEGWETRYEVGEGETDVIDTNPGDAPLLPDDDLDFSDSSDGSGSSNEDEKKSKKKKKEKKDKKAKKAKKAKKGKKGSDDDGLSEEHQLEAQCTTPTIHETCNLYKALRGACHRPSRGPTWR